MNDTLSRVFDRVLHMTSIFMGPLQYRPGNTVGVVIRTLTGHATTRGSNSGRARNLFLQTVHNDGGTHPTQ